MSWSSRRLWIGTGLVAGASALFGLGALAAVAVGGGDDDDDLDRALSADGPGVATAPEKSDGASGGVRPQVAEDHAGVSSLSPSPAEPPWPGRSQGGGDAEFGFGRWDCPGKLDGLLAGSTLALDTETFAFRSPGPAFELSSLSIGASQPCSDSELDADHLVSASTSWLHAGTGIHVWLDQRPQEERTANVAYQGSLEFWDGGYRFSLSGGPVLSPFSDIRPPAGDGEGIASVLEEALGQLAPELDLACFYRQAEGSWADLAAMGIGDPRPAIPSGYDESSVTVNAFRRPPDSCGEPDFSGSAYFHAEFIGAGDSYIGIDAYSADEEDSGYFGELYDHGASWSNGRYWFNIWEKSRSDSTSDLILDLARALDPDFSADCFRQTRTLLPGESESIGLPAPEAPGFKVARSDQSVTEVGSACQLPGRSGPPSYSLSWTLEGEGGSMIEVYLNRLGTEPGGRRYGSRWDFGLEWGDGDGNSYSVYGEPGDGGPDDLRQALETIALSLDPDLDLDALSREMAVEETPPRPVPDR
ncbi:MAG: hypothetical protein ACE5EF_07100 [Dehalococcoidia bacterium]